MSRLRIKRIAGAVCAVIILTAGAAPFLWAGTDRVIPGVRINGTPAGGMSREELETLMHEKNEELKTASLTKHGSFLIFLFIIKTMKSIRHSKQAVMGI